MGLVGAAFAAVGLRWIGRSGNDLSVIALAIGVVLSLTVFGLLITWPIPVTLVAGGIALAGLLRLFGAVQRTPGRRRPRRGPPSPTF